MSCTRRSVLGAVRSALGFPFDLSQLNLPPQFGASVSPKLVDLIISGPLPILDTLAPGDIQVVVDLSSMSAQGTFQVVPTVQMRNNQLKAALRIGIVGAGGIEPTPGFAMLEVPRNEGLVPIVVRESALDVRRAHHCEGLGEQCDVRVRCSALLDGCEFTATSRSAPRGAMPMGRAPAPPSEPPNPLVMLWFGRIELCEPKLKFEVCAAKGLAGLNPFIPHAWPWTKSAGPGEPSHFSDNSLSFVAASVWLPSAPRALSANPPISTNSSRRKPVTPNRRRTWWGWISAPGRPTTL